LAQNAWRPDVICKDEQQARIECVAFFGRESLMRFDQRFVEIIWRFKVRRSNQFHEVFFN